MCDTAILEKQKADTGGGCSICGGLPAVNVDGSYWMCGPCVLEKMDEWDTTKEFLVGGGWITHEDLGKVETRAVGRNMGVV